MKSDPIILTSSNDRRVKIKRIDAGPQFDMDEKWLQKLIYENPYILPVEYFDGMYSPLIPLGREIQTISGNIDNLYISPWGQITLVETKLWKNPEKHRTVVAQIIDYAKEISQWGYSDLEQAISKAHQTICVSNDSLLDKIIQPHVKELKIDEFQERVISNLRAGKFLLLIVGDRISPRVTLLSDAISGVPGMEFTLGLIELRLYNFSLQDEQAKHLLIIPHVVGKTVEEIRAIVKIQYEKEEPKILVEISKEPQKGKTTPDIFLQQVVSSDLRQVYELWFEKWQTKNFIVFWGTNGFSLRVKVKRKVQTIMDAYPELGISLIREIDVKRLGASNEQYASYLDGIQKVSRALNILESGKKYLTYENMTPDSLMTIIKYNTAFADEIMDK
jgi:hypothetical protein